MQILINIIIISSLLYIVFKIFQLKKLYEAFDIIIIKFMKGVTDLYENDKTALVIIEKIVDKMNKHVANLSYLQKDVNNLQKENISFNNSISVFNENINTNGRVFKEATNVIRSKLSDLNMKTNKLSLITNKLDIIEKRFEDIEKRIHS